MKWSENSSVMSDSLWPHGLYSPWNSPGQNTGVGSLPLLQRIFPTQGSNPVLPHCRQILYQLSHKGSSGWIETHWTSNPGTMSPSWALYFRDSTLAFLYLSFLTMWGIWEEWRRGKKVISPCQSPVHATPSGTPDPCPNVWHLLAGPCCLLFCFHPPEGSPLLLAAQPLQREAKTWQLVRLWGMVDRGGLALWCGSSSVTQGVGGERVRWRLPFPGPLWSTECQGDWAL